MATFSVWANLNVCAGVEDLARVAAALGEAGEASRAAGCSVRLGDMEVGDHEVEVAGEPGAVGALLGGGGLRRGRLRSRRDRPGRRGTGGVPANPGSAVRRCCAGLVGERSFRWTNAEA